MENLLWHKDASKNKKKSLSKFEGKNLSGKRKVGNSITFNDVDYDARTKEH